MTEFKGHNHGEYDDTCPICYLDAEVERLTEQAGVDKSFIEQYQLQVATLSAEGKVIAEALNHVVWVKYCGIDGRDADGVYKNFPAQERDSMYDIALKALKETGKLSDNMKSAVSTRQNKAPVLPETETQMESDGETDAVRQYETKSYCTICGSEEDFHTCAGSKSLSNL